MADSNGSNKATMAGREDRISALPDALLQHVLSFLSSLDAVRTCVLARRWRDQWKTVPALRVTSADVLRFESARAQRFGSARELNRFVNCLLLFRDRRSPLHVVQISSFWALDEEEVDEAVMYFEPWVRYSLSCQAQEHHVINSDDAYFWPLPRRLITSQHLKMLELVMVELKEGVLDFSCCPALENLKLDFCTICTSRIMSPSLKHLSIRDTKFALAVRVQISTPGLISLQLADCFRMVPLLESMPSLVSAFIRLENCSDCCQNNYEIGDCGDDSCEEYMNISEGNNTHLLLQGLSHSTNLELIAARGVFIFRKDLIWCPVFKKLKTLLLNEWFMTANLSVLICFLQHARILEKLILQLCKIPEIVETGASYDITDQPIASKKLTVEVKCLEVDERISNVLKVLCSYGLPPESIEIQQPPKLKESTPDIISISGSFSFEQKRT